MRIRLLVVCLAAAVGSGCAKSVCERSSALSGKKGDCAQALGDPLAPASTCTARSQACASGDQKVLEDALTCLEGLSSCEAATEVNYRSKEAACLAGLSGLSDACSKSLFGDTLPGTDGGTDAGEPVDAGRQALDGGAIELIAVADETRMALAWVQVQAGQAAKWELATYEDGGRTDATLTPGTLRALMQNGVATLAADGGPGAPIERSFFITGLLNDGTVVIGAAPDAGSSGFMCQSPFDCPSNQICDLGTCHVEACSVSNPVCPAGYDCPSGSCVRTADAGSFDAGSTSSGGTFTAQPFISNLVTARTGRPSWAPETPIGGFVSRRPDIAAIDSARQIVVMEQENQPVGHVSVRRGKDLLSDLGTASVIDTVGDHVKVTYVPDSDTIFACYNVGRGVRVRRSRDHGRTWGNDALTFEPADDGGFTSRMHSCALAPWRNGAALMVNVDDDTLVVRTLTEALSVQTTEVAFVSSPADAGNIYNPSQPAIGTAPDAGIVHVAFSAQRALGGGSDYEVYDVVRTPTTGGYTQPKWINQVEVSPGNFNRGNGQNQGYPTVAVNPADGRAVAAFTAVEGAYSNVYVSMFFPAGNEWTTGADLQVFVKQLTEYLLFPARTGLVPEWDAFSPTVRISHDGKIWLGFVAGKQPNPPATTRSDYHPYAVRFDFAAQSPVGGRGWFIRPAEQLSTTLVLDPRQGGGQVIPTVSSLAVDGQLSVYSTYVEGLGAFNEIENRAVFLSRP